MSGKDFYEDDSGDASKYYRPDAPAQASFFSGAPPAAAGTGGPAVPTHTPATCAHGFTGSGEHLQGPRERYEAHTRATQSHLTLLSLRSSSAPRWLWDSSRTCMTTVSVPLTSLGRRRRRRSRPSRSSIASDDWLHRSHAHRRARSWCVRDCFFVRLLVTEEGSGFRDDINLIHDRQGPASEPAVAEAAPAPSAYSWWQPEFYRYLFNVDTVEVLNRLRKSLVPWPPNFVEIARQNPDLYVHLPCELFSVTLTVRLDTARSGLPRPWCS